MHHLRNPQARKEATGDRRGKYMVNPHKNGKKTIKKKTTTIPRKDVMPASPKKKSAAEIYYSSIKGYKGKAGGQNPKSKSYKEKMADKHRADVRDAARGGFKSVASMKKKGSLARIGQRAKKQKKAELTKLKGKR